MHVVAALFAAGAVIFGGDAKGFATVKLEGPAGAQLLIDGQPVATFGADERLKLQLSAVSHTLVVKQDGRVIARQDVMFGRDSNITLTMRGPIK